jgi:8-hydroxy-5-deazaflavin:NADPH oxidoreductase
MKSIAILGTGSVGRSIGTKMIQLGHAVRMGSRTADNINAVQWAGSHGEQASAGTFSDATKFGDLIFNCTNGASALEILPQAGEDSLKDKILVDVSNPLDFSRGMPPILIPEFANTTSLGEVIQERFPVLRVVKTLNMVNCDVMVDASIPGGESTMLLCGNDESAKAEVKSILNQFGWTDIIDLGGITGSRGMEMMLPAWLNIWSATGDVHFGFRIVRKPKP